MDRRQIATALILRELGVAPRLDSFTDRLVLQKATYLAQAAGFDLGYHYGWYLRGPYCSQLAKDMFAAASDPVGLDDLLPSWKLDKQSRSELRRLIPLVGADDADRPRRLELVASVHFLITRRQVVGHGPKAITKRLRAFGKNYTAAEVEEAIRSLESAKLLTPSQHRPSRC